jgi:hypothetical protein
MDKTSFHEGELKGTVGGLIERNTYVDHYSN